MTVGGRDAEVAAIVRQLGSRLDELRNSVGALTEILTRPPAGGGETDERLVPQ